MVWRPADRAQRIPRSARPNSILRPEGALLTPSKRGASGPTISFLEKETVPPGGTREKSSGQGCRSSYLKLKCAPTPHAVFREAQPAQQGGGPGGTSSSSGGAVTLTPPGAFLLDRQAARSLFARKENGGPEALPLGEEKSAPPGAKKSWTPPVAGTPRAARNKKAPLRAQSKKARLSRAFFQRGLFTRRSYSAAARAYSTSSSMEVMS